MGVSHSLQERRLNEAKLFRGKEGQQAVHAQATVEGSWAMVHRNMLDVDGM